MKEIECKSCGEIKSVDDFEKKGNGEYKKYCRYCEYMGYNKSIQALKRLAKSNNNKGRVTKDILDSLSIKDIKKRQENAYNHFCRGKKYAANYNYTRDVDYEREYKMPSIMVD